MRYWRQQHIRKSTDFQEIRTSGKTWRCGFFYLNFLARPDQPEPLRRVGVIASKRTGNAVQRNRAKRLLREIFRLNQDCLPESCDLVLVARSGIKDAQFSELESRFREAIRKLNPTES